MWWRRGPVILGAAVAAATLMPLVADVRVPLEAVRVYVPAVLMVRPVKVATPLTAVPVTVPPSTAPLVPPDRASVTGPV